MYICVYISSSSSSSCRTASTDLPDSPLPPVSIVHHSWEVFKAISCIGTEQLYIGSSWCSCLCSSMWRGSQEYIAYEFLLTSWAASHMSGSSDFDSFRDGWLVAVQLLFVGFCLQDLFNIACSFHISLSCRAASMDISDPLSPLTLSFLASGRSSGLYPVSSHSCCMYVLAGCPAFARPYVGVHRSTSLMSSSLLLQQCPACLVRLTW